MALLMLFALVAGAGTALSPCVLPVLPALLSAGVTGGRRRPVGIALGLAATFTVTIVGLASVIDGVGLGPGADADAGRRRAHRLRHRRGRAVAGRAPGGAAGAPLAPGPAQPRRRLRLGPARRRRAGLRLRAVRGADPGRGHRRRGRVVAHGARRPRLRAGLGARAAGALARRARPRRARARHGARPGPAARAGRRPHPHRRRHGDEPRRALPVGHRRPPARRAGQPDAQPRDLARRVQPAQRPARPVALRGRGHRAPGRRRGAPAAPGRRAGLHGQPALVQHARRPGR